MHVWFIRLIKSRYPEILFLLLSLFLVFSWFRFGHLYGGGDAGLSFFNPLRIYEIARFIWWEASAPGFPVPQGLSSVPTEYILSFLQILGFSNLHIEMVVFLIILSFMGIGMYRLALLLGLSKRYSTLSGMFYMLNPYSMIMIWHRFIPTRFFLIAALPFLIMFWISWIRKKQFLYLILFLLTNLLAVYLYGTIAFIITIWTLLILITLAEGIFPWKNAESFLRLGLYFFIGFLFWVLTNSWWILPTASIDPNLFTEQHNVDESVSTLLAISRQASLPYTLQMLNPFYAFEQAELGETYKSPLFRFFPWVGVIVIFVGLIKGLYDYKFAKFGVIYILIIFLTKGASMPFGNLYLWGFTNFFFLGIIRNPFEKIGILLPVVTSIFFAVGLETIRRWVKNRTNNYLLMIVSLIIILPLIIYISPMFTGKIFGKPDQPNFADFSNDYQLADIWISNQVRNEHLNGKILHLPLTRSEAVTLVGSSNYNGIESSSFLFNSLPSISKGFNLHRIDDTLTGLYLMFEESYGQNSDKTLQLLQNFNIRFIVLRKDIVWQGNDMYDPQKTEEILNKLNFLEKKVQFGDLTIYELSSNYYKPKVLITDQVQLVSPEKATIRMWPWLARLNEGEILTTFNDKDIDTILRNSNEIMIFPDNSFNYLESSESGLDIIATSLANLLYQFSGIQRTLNYTGDKDNEALVTKLISTGEKLVNIYVYIRNNNSQLAVPLLNKYTKEVNELMDEDIRSSKLRFYISESSVNDFFKLQLQLLEKMNFNELLAIKDKIKQDLTNRELLPAYSYINKKDFTIQERRISDFKIPISGKYELLLTNSQLRSIYPGELDNLDFQIDNKLFNLKGISKGSLMSYGEVELEKGTHEISFDNSPSINLILSLEGISKTGNISLIDKNTLQLSSDGQKVADIEADLGIVSGEDTYQVAFDGSFLEGDVFYVQIIQDNDLVKNDKPQSRIITSISRTKNDNNFQTFKFSFPPLNVATRHAKIKIVVDPTGTTVSRTPVYYGIPTSVQIKNLKVTRVLNEGVFLRSGINIDNQLTKSGQITKIVQESPVQYKGSLEVNKPSFIIFKESYHPDWELTLINGNNEYKPSKHFLLNLYGNAWFIEKEGKYDFRLEFKSQQKVTLGVYLAILGWGISLSLLVITKFRRKR